MLEIYVRSLLLGVSATLDTVAQFEICDVE